MAKENNPAWSTDPIAPLATKWHEVPISMHERGSTRNLLSLSNSELLEWWNAKRRAFDVSHGLLVTTWCWIVYRDFVRNRKIIEVGPGLGMQGIFFLECGAEVTFVDVAQSNLKLIQRLCDLKGHGNAKFLHLKSFDVINSLDTDYDAVFAGGSLHHAPAGATKPEFEALASRLKPDGRFIMAAYPKSRWEADGSPPFDQWGKITDGEATPWAEWYDARKLLQQLAPYRFHLLMYLEYQSGDMNWIDVVRTDGNPDFAEAKLPSAAKRIDNAVNSAMLITEPQWADASTNQRGPDVVVSTGVQRWSYAARASVATDSLPAGLRLACCIRYNTKKVPWEIGAVAATAASRLLASGNSVGNSIIRRKVKMHKLIPVPDLSQIASVVIRNTSPSGRAPLPSIRWRFGTVSVVGAFRSYRWQKRECNDDDQFNFSSALKPGLLR